MNILVRGQRVPVSEGLEQHCVARLTRALLPFAGQVTRAEMVLTDVNGTRKGLGNECRLLVELEGAVALHFSSRGRDYYQAATQAAWAAGRTVARARGKRRQHHSHAARRQHPAPRELPPLSA